MGDRFATTDTVQKLGAVPLSRGKGSSPSNNVAWAEVYLRTKWHLDHSSHLATTAENLRAVFLFWGRGAGSPSNNVACADTYLRTK